MRPPHHQTLPKGRLAAGSATRAGRSGMRHGWAPSGKQTTKLLLSLGGALADIGQSSQAGPIIQVLYPQQSNSQAWSERTEQVTRMNTLLCFGSKAR